MPNFSTYKKKEGDKKFIVDVSCYVNAKNAEEARDFIHTVIKFKEAFVGGVGISARELSKVEQEETCEGCGEFLVYGEMVVKGEARHSACS